MPIYVWKCSKCGYVVEELRKIGEDKPPKSCCDLQKQLTTANFRIEKAAG